MRMALVLGSLLVAGSAVAEKPAKPAVTASVLDVQKRGSSGYVQTAPESLDAARANAFELGACTKGFAIKPERPAAAVLHSVTVVVGKGGKVTKVLPLENRGDAAACIAKIVERWELPDEGELTVRVGMMPPVKRNPKLPKGYVAALQAACDAATGDIEETVARIKDALVRHPNKDVEKLFSTLAGRFPSERDHLFGAVLANAGIASCKLRDLQ